MASPSFGRKQFISGRACRSGRLSSSFWRLGWPCFNSTFGLVNTSSLFGWWKWTINKSPDEGHAWFIPLVVIGLLLWKRKELEALPKKLCWPALGIIVLALVLHILGYMIQQARVSVVAFALGLYGLTGVLWGKRWLQATFLPFTLFIFCVPVGDLIEKITFPLRLVSTKLSCGFSDAVLGIHVIQNGTSIFDSKGAYQYEVAPACSGIQSLTAMLSFSVIYGYVTFQATWRRLLIIASAFPLAILGNVLRLALIIVAAQTFGHDAGNYVHQNWFLFPTSRSSEA
jgi:exosortase